LADQLVTLAENLRPWHTAGIFWILQDAEIPEKERQAAFFSGQGASAAQDPSLQAEVKAGRKTAQPAAGRKTGEDAEPLPEAPSLPRREISPMRGECLPPAWEELLRKTPAAPLLWTYAELGEDLRGSGNRARSAALRELVGRLGLPRGSSSFWPLILERSPSFPETDPAPEAVFFQQGLNLLRPLAVIFFGERCCSLSGLALACRLPFTQEIKDGRLFLLLPAWGGLLADKGLRERSFSYLHAALSSISTLRRR
jgi:hypothetical protein